MHCYVRSLLVSVLLLLPAASVLALKAPEPGSAVQQPAPAPATPPATTPTGKPTPGKTPTPARPPAVERVQADSAVSFPVDI